MNKRLQIRWYLVLFLHALCYFLPFLNERMGFLFFGDGLEALFKRRISLDEIPVFFAFFSPITFLLVLVFFYWRIEQLTLSKFWNRVFIVFMCCPTLLAMFFVVQKEGLDGGTGSLVFWGWACSFWVLFGIYYHSKKILLLDEDKDISEHLIE